jgi:ribosome maturation protein SDO1
MPGQAIYDKEEVSFNLARLKKAGKTFEIVIDPDKAVELKEGKAVAISEALKSEYVFTEAKRGLQASPIDLKAVFGTDDTLKCAEIIIRDGEVQLTAEHRKRFRDIKHRIILEMIHRNGVDPHTHRPHPLNRIEMAMEEAKVKIDEFKRPEEQIPGIVRQLQVVLPIKMETAEVSIHIDDAQLALKSYSIVKANGTIILDEWKKDGSWHGVVEMPAGMTEEFFAKINKATKGDAEMNIVKTR